MGGTLQAYPQQFLAKVWFGKSRTLWWRAEVTLQTSQSGNVEKVMIHDFLEGPGWQDELKRSFYLEGSEHGDPFHRERFCNEYDFKGSRDLEGFDLHILADDGATFDLYVEVEGAGGRQFVFRRKMFTVHEDIGAGFINVEAIKRLQLT